MASCNLRNFAKSNFFREIWRILLITISLLCRPEYLLLLLFESLMKLKTFFSWGKRKVNSGNFQDVLPNLGLPLICVESWNPWWNFFATQHWQWLNLDLLFDDGLIFYQGRLSKLFSSFNILVTFKYNYTPFWKKEILRLVWRSIYFIWLCLEYASSEANKTHGYKMRFSSRLCSLLHFLFH